MNKITSAVKAFLADENGITAIEYALMAALMGGALVYVINTGGFKNYLTNAFTTIGTNLVSHAAF